MMRYDPISDAEPNMQENSQSGRYYWAEDVRRLLKRIEFYAAAGSYIEELAREALKDGHPARASGTEPR